MHPTEPLHLIVIDDIVRFAMHLWRYIAGTPGFGIGEAKNDDKFFWVPPEPQEPQVTSDGKEVHSNSGKGIPEHWIPFGRQTPDGKAVIWWVEAFDSRWRTQLDKVFEALGHMQPVVSWMALVDVRGAPPGSGTPKDLVDPYKASAVVEYLEGYGGRVAEEDNTEVRGKILLISSYRRYLFLPASKEGRAAGSVRVLPKNGTMFQNKIVDRFIEPRPLEDEVPEDNPTEETSIIEKKKQKSIAEGLSLLITGAGFERSHTFPGRPGRSLGVPTTAKIVRRAVGGIEAPEEGEDGESLYIPDRYRMRPPWSAEFEKLHQAAKQRDLDSYWDELLRLEHLGLSQEGEKRATGKLDGLRSELRLRESFRDALMRDDWGHLHQVLSAAHCYFDSWLTTNYTRFANRAIQVCNASEEKQDERHWRIISTSNEATRRLQELLHLEESSLTAPNMAENDLDSDHVSQSGESQGHELRYLFKLHGDIPHVTTMALAGHDKEVTSPLSVPIDSLHEIYMVAERHLEEQTFHCAGPIVWHIVGHSLWDTPLRRLIRRVIQKSSSCGHLFILVDIDIPKKASSSWVRLLQTLPATADKKWTICCVESTAHEYLARLRSAQLEGRLGKQLTRKTVGKWLGNLGYISGRADGAPAWKHQRYFRSFSEQLPPFRIAWWSTESYAPDSP